MQPLHNTSQITCGTGLPKNPSKQCPRCFTYISSTWINDVGTIGKFLSQKLMVGKYKGSIEILRVNPAESPTNIEWEEIVVSGAKKKRTFSDKIGFLAYCVVSNFLIFDLPSFYNMNPPCTEYLSKQQACHEKHRMR